MFLAFKKAKKRKKGDNLQIKQRWRFKTPRGLTALPRKIQKVKDIPILRSPIFSISSVIPFLLHRGHFRIKRRLFKKRKLRIRKCIVHRFRKTFNRKYIETPFWYFSYRRRYVRWTRRNRRSIYRGYSHLTSPITRKPAQLRMGKGKGEIKKWCVPIYSGKLLWKLGVGRHAGMTYRLVILFLKKLKRGSFFQTPQVSIKRTYFIWNYYTRFYKVLNPYFRVIIKKKWKKMRLEQLRRQRRGY